MMMFIELANRVIEEVRRHPYWWRRHDTTMTQLNAPIPDLVMIDGLRLTTLSSKVAKDGILTAIPSKSNGHT